mmetsp:Transcript_90436/g.281563  ORF Transcript_90436/g.281563 Transcript_90436/m.281563 type:complete len:253 (+) Transcript_90436:74-832(+)
MDRPRRAPGPSIFAALTSRNSQTLSNIPCAVSVAALLRRARALVPRPAVADGRLREIWALPHLLIAVGEAATRSAAAPTLEVEAAGLRLRKELRALAAVSPAACLLVRRRGLVGWVHQVLTGILDGLPANLVHCLLSHERRRHRRLEVGAVQSTQVDFLWLLRDNLAPLRRRVQRLHSRRRHPSGLGPRGRRLLGMLSFFPEWRHRIEGVVMPDLEIRLLWLLPRICACLFWTAAHLSFVGHAVQYLGCALL